MKKVYALLFAAFLTSTLAIAQPTVFYTNLTSTTTPALTNSRLLLNDLGAFRQTRFQTTAAPAPATQTYAFHIGTDVAPDYSVCWRPYTPADATGVAYALNTVTVPSTVVNSARYNTASGGTDGNLAALANTTYYTVNTQENAGSDNLSAIWSHTFNPVTFSAVSQAPLAGSVNPGNPVTVTFTASVAPNASELMYVRYSINGFTTSSIVQASFVGTAGTAIIPGLASGNNVSYYIFSSNRTAAQLATIVGTAGVGQAGYDMATLNLENNAGANYSYTVNAGPNPITVNASGGILTADYGSLQTAFDAINAGTHTGTITVLVNANTTEVATCTLNASGAGAASYTSIAVNPAGGGARTISGAIPAGTPMIDMNGADNVTFDGLNSGGNSLTIENTTASATSGTSTFRFIGGATSNTLNRCILKGAVSSSVATNGAIVFFSTDAVTANGNDNNTVSNCDIGPSGANLPTKAILGNGSTTTTAIGNSGITINNNDIHDFFGAAVTSSGIATNGGCNTWTITNNRFYQTGTRTWTTGAAHIAIDIRPTTATSGAQGFTITGNTIGYASNTQTGVYTLTGSSGIFRGIVVSAISVSSGGTLNTINSNKIASVSLTGVTSSGTSTSSPFLAIMVTNGLANTNNNIIGSQTATGSLTYSTTTTSSTDVYGIYNFSVDDWNCVSDSVGGISVTNAGASGTFVIYGLRANTTTTKAFNASLNLVGGTVANSIQLNATGTASQVVGMQTPNAISTFTNNTIRNLTNNIGTGTTTSASVAGIIFTSTTPVQTLTGNTIYNLTNTNATAASVVTGIQFTGGTGNIVQRNLIYDLSVATNSATSEVNGIRVAGGTTTYRNNMIRLGAGIANAIGAVASNSSTTGINGFNGALGTDNFWHNSIYIEGAPTAGTGASYAFNGTQTVNTRSFRDNIFFNARANAGATGANYAVKLNGTVPNPTGLTISNNVYFANGAGGVFGYYNGANVANLAAWQAAVGQDAGSIEADPLYVSATDLHIQAGSPAIDVAFNLGVTNDFDQDSRPGANALYDIGADERDGIPAVLNDIQATTLVDPANGGSKLQGASFSPQANYTNLGINNQTNVTVKYRILNAVPAEIYAQTFVIPSLNAGANTNVTFPSTSIATPGVYTIQAIALLAGDQVVANDTLTGTLNILPPLSGTYTVGSGGNYPSLTNGSGIFDAINNLGASSNLTIDIISDLTGELGTVALNELAGGYSVRIRPSGAARTVTGSNTGALIKINGADSVTIDGSLTGATAGSCLIGGDAAIRQLTVQNTNTGTSATVISIQSGTNGAKKNVLKNVNVLGQDPTTTLLGISIGGNTPGTIGTDNDSNRVENCSVKRAIFGIYSAGLSAANMNVNNIITQNELDSTSVTDRIRRVGIVVFNDSIGQVTYNRITGVNTTESADAIGIAMGNQAIDNTITTSGNIVGALVANNKINGVASLSATGFSAAGITIAGGSTGSNTIRNNMITGVTAPATSPDIPAGIFVVGATGANTRLYYNSVSMTGDRGTVASQMPSFGIAITGTDPTVDLRNNILYTSQIASGGGVNAKSYAIGMVSTTFVNLNSNYNTFWSTGANDGGFRTGSLGTAAGTDYAALTGAGGWQTAVSDDANSLEVDPLFVNPLNDLHITTTNCSFKGLGIPIAGITDDYDCNGRNATTPDIGADEFNPAATAATLVAGSVNAGATVNQAVRYTVIGATNYLYACDRIIATVTPSGAQPVAGNITAGVRVDTGATKMGTTRLYAARFYDVLPVNNAAAATGTVKLYFLQSEFDNFNLKALDSNYYPLPDAGNSFNLDSLRILIYHGAPSGGFFPGNYSGATEELSIASPGVSVIWNPAGNNGTGWWEVTFPANGFSGYFISSKPRSPLPVKVEYFRGSKQGSSHVLDWKVVPVNTTTGLLTLERSSDSRNFTGIYSITATALRMQQPFSYTSTNPLNGMNYYRLKMVDDNGVVTYSSIVALLNTTKGFEIINITPNPVTEGRFKLNITSAEQMKMDVVVTDLTGRVLQQQKATIISGFSAVEVNVSNLAAGTYQVYGVTAEGRTKVLQFVKQ